jgi:hypothetical protein
MDVYYEYILLLIMWVLILPDARQALNPQTLEEYISSNILLVDD